MRASAPNGRLNAMVRWVVAIPLTLFGGFVYLASPLLGAGVHLDPMPGEGALAAGASLVIAFCGYWLVRREKKADVVAIINNIVLTLGTLSLLGGLLRWVFQRMYQVQSSEVGHSRPGELLFLITYGIISVGALAVFNLVVRERQFRTQ